MSSDISFIWVIICLIVIFLLWRVLLQLAVLAFVLLVLVSIWTSEGYAASARLVATAVVVAAAVWLVRVSGIGGGANERRVGRSSSSTYNQPCSRCGGIGRTACAACLGSGQGPGGQGNVLGPSVPCSYCGGSGWNRCSCRG